MIARLALLALLVLPGLAIACPGFEPEGWAWPRYGPLPVAGDADGGSAFLMPIAQNTPIPVRLGPSGRYAGCIEETIVHIKAADIVLVEETARVGPGISFDADERARLVFWDGLAQVWAYLGGTVEPWSVPGLREMPAADTVAHPAPDWPVFAQSRVPILDGRRDVLIAGVLVPISLTALDTYAGALETPAGSAEAVFIVDLSARSSGYVAPLMKAFAGLLEADADFRDTRLAVIRLARGQPPARISAGSVSELARVDWAHTPPADGQPKDLREALDMAVEAAAPEAPIFVLAAGDMDRGDATPRDRVTYVQITPELDEGLRRVAAGTRFVDFEPGLHTVVYELFARRVARRPARELEADDLEAFAEAMAAAGYTPIAPVALRDVGRFGQAMALPDGAEWFARPLWVVVNGDVLRVEAP